MKKKTARFTPHEDFDALVRWLPDPASLFGVNRVTLARWRNGESRVPYAAAQLARLLRGELPAEFGEWRGWRFAPDGVAYPPGWGEGVRRGDIIDCWTWRRKAFLVDGLLRENERMKKELALLRQEVQIRSRLGFAGALVDVLTEAP